ncbi:hypothetical protein B0H65DRAFT_72260 [Neurospora tetraspora]|uniref:Ankyrin repeat protein n=1 Tax=Neurospora tetraspora TaxID=94610 RepID=A0AAE0MXS4_9PEZI|nr:hypothetical protein B0H65DRAFT_72260 [Neurospora tetraspora]
MATSTFPQPPVPHSDLVKHIANHPETPMVELLQPYREYEARLRQAYAQEPDSELLKDPYVNVLPLFTDNTSDIKIRARNIETESEEERARYIMPLPKNMRRPDQSPAVVQSHKEFQRNFNIFSESSLVELNWDNVVAAGSSVVNCILPVPKKYSGSKRLMREFYHEKFSPASDVDLFLYGLTEEQAIEKIKEIESQVRDALLCETTTVRTKHAVTICSQYPTRHIQIVLRIYKSVSEILTGFDIDCSGAAYDGKQVYCTPRALQSYMTQTNHIDLTRRSPSYENRLSKYSRRGFEVYWPELDRSRIDPTIFERSFMRTLGLARLLVLERLPTAKARDNYVDQRRQERGRPALNRFMRKNFRAMGGNIKDDYDDEIADWVNEEEVSNYHTFTIPYGPKFHAKKIEKLCYTRDLLLNAEWNQRDDRTVYLHRHPAFFGRFKDVVEDCCGHCPVPQTDEEKDIAEEEAKIYVSGRISFIKDDPGRQQIGSFNPLTDDDWTEMAYIGNTARLCQAIVDEDVEHVQDWLAQEGADPNTRDHTGRTPLHLAVMSSSPEVVRALVEAGARLTARLADGRTALHLAASRGDVEIIKILMNKSNTNEEEFEELEDQRRKARAALREQKTEKMDVDDEKEDDSEDIEMIEADDTESDAGGDKMSIATGSFVKVDKTPETPAPDGTLPAENEEGPDFYEVNQVAWDIPCSALHFAILEGHDEVVKLLCQEYGADVLLPVKFLQDKNKALLTLVLVMALPIEKAKSMAQTLLSLGATVAQADLNSCTVFAHYVERNARTLLDLANELDKAGYKTAINHVLCEQWSRSDTPLLTAIRDGNLGMVVKLLETGAVPEIDFETWLKSARQSAMESRLSDFESNKELFRENLDRPLIAALQSKEPSVALELLERGCDPNTLHPDSARALHNTYSSRWKGKTALDMVRSQLKALRKYKGETTKLEEPKPRLGLDTYLQRFKEGTYQHWAVSGGVKLEKIGEQTEWKEYEKGLKCLASTKGISEKEQAIRDAIATLEKIEQSIISKGGKTFKELYPDRKEDGNDDSSSSRHGYYLGYTSDRASSTKEPYQYNFVFTGVQDMTETKQAAYVELFEAVWNGDLDKVKKFTLTSWDDAKQQPPLKIAVEGHNGHNPFTLALQRGHYDLAKAVLEIAQAQYSPPEKAKTRYTMNKSGEVDEEDDDDSSSDESAPRIVGETVDDQFTIDTIGQVSMQVKSHTLPVNLLKGRTATSVWGGGRWGNRQVLINGEDTWDPLTYAVTNNDLKLLKFVLDMGEHFGSLQLDPATEPPKFFSVPDGVFAYAIGEGRIEVMAELIRRTGAGLPLEHLVEGSGLELKEQPRYYQGLSVYGKKRKDWANAGREVAQQPRDENSTTSPLLRAAEDRCIESIQWFLSDAPLRHYLEFAKSKAAREDPRMQHLGRAPGGVEGAIARWLDDQGELIIHVVIVKSGQLDVSDLVSYLIKACPEALEAKSHNNLTPLMQAVYMGRIELVKILLEAGADPNVKTSAWNNILHAALLHTPPVDKLKELLSLFDREAVIRMITERSSLAIDGRTPLHQWLNSIGGNEDHDKSIAVFNLLVEMSSEAVTTALNMLNASGDTPLHDMLKSNHHTSKLIRAVLDFQPSLLFRENAVGRTPVEVVHDELISSRVTSDGGQQRHHRLYRYGNDGYRYLLAEKPHVFLSNNKSDQEKWSREHDWHHGNDHNTRRWALCQEYLAKLSSTPPPSRSASPPTEGQTQAHARDQSPPKRRKLTTETEGRLNAHIIATNKLKEKRTLVSLPEANDVAKRLGEMKMGSKYNYQLAPEEEDQEEEVKRFADDETPFASKPDRRTWGDGVRFGKWRKGRGEKETPRKSYYALGNSAWKDVRKSGEKAEEKEEWGKCMYCQQYHTMSGEQYDRYN